MTNIKIPMTKKCSSTCRNKFVWTLRFVFLLVIGILTLDISANAEPISAVNIHFQGDVRRTSEAEILKVLPVKAGDEFSSANIDKTLDFLRKWGVFEKIDLGTSPGAKGTNIDLYLTEAVLIGSIDVVGNYPYIKRKITKHLTIHSGDMYLQSRVDEQVKRIKDFYDREGIYNTEVSAIETWNVQHDDIDIKFKIDRGPIIRFDGITINGASYFPKGRIVSAINPLRTYNPRRFNDAIRSVQDFYRTHGFPKAKIDVVRKDINFDTNQVSIDINVTEGPRVIVDFVGNRSFTTRKLQKQLTIFDEGSFEEYELELSDENLAKFYRENGFPDVKISHESLANPDGSQLLIFRIEEGKNEKINSIRFEGNKAMSVHKLRKYMQTHEVSLLHKGIYNRKILENDFSVLKDQYGREGYLNAKIGPAKVEPDNVGLKITVPVDEDGRTIVDNIYFEGNHAYSRDVLLQKLKNAINKPFNPRDLEQDRQILLNFYADNGRPYATVNYTTFTMSADHIVIRYDIDEGELVRFGQILIVGNSLTLVKSIKKTLPIKEGEVYSQKKVLDSNVALRRLGAFQAINIERIGFAEQEKIVHIRIKVEEQKPYTMDFDVSYSTDLGFSGSTNFTDYNTFGTTKRSGLKLLGGQQLSRAEIFWTDPRFVGSDIELTVAPWFQYENKLVFTYLQAGGGFGFFRRFHRTSASARYQIMRNYFVQGDSNAADAYSLRDSTISKISLSYSFDTRNSFSDPSRGIYAMMTSDFYDEIKGKHANFVKLNWYFANAQGFLKYFIISNNLRLGMIETIGRDVSVPSSELFLMGGGDTVRGFKQDSLGPVNSAGQPTGGRERWIYNGELRIKVYGNWRLIGFFDMGALVNNFSDVNWDTIRQSAGFGIRYMTPVGPIRMDYGFNLDQKPNEDYGRLHFTFGYVF